ncbi:MAG: hypothetical protein HRU82_03435 [Nitrospira sp.]|nr:MAG: hypothetical protein HRU82_03435 [Nitrospira sp.]
MELAKAVAATFAVVGQEMPDIGLATIVSELQGYPLGDVLKALTRCRKELRKITLADIIDRIPSGHPGIEEAWAMIAGLLGDEDRSVVWTEEMAEAYGVARHLAHDKVAARLAFKESYSKAVAEARDQKRPPKWRVSLGHDPHGRQGALEEAVRLGRIPAEHAQKLLPDYSIPEGVTLPKLRIIA